MASRDELVDRRKLLHALGVGVAAGLGAACGDGASLADDARDASRPGSAARDAGSRPSDASKPQAPPLDGGADSSTPRDSARPTTPREAGVKRTLDLVDFHAHFLPQAYVERAVAAGQTPDGRESWPSWDFDEHLAFMDETGVEISVLSISSPGVHFGDDQAAAQLAKLVNDEAAALARREPKRIRFLASLPLPDVTGAIAEWRRVRTEPGCVGAIVLSNSQGVYPGDARFDALWEQLNSAPTLVLVHPTAPPDWKQVSPDEPSATMEVYFESMRACVTMFEASTLTRYPNIRFVIPNCGGALPVMLDRMRTFGIAGYSIDPNVTTREHQQLWFDCAGTPFPTQLPALLQQTTIERVVYGSESGFTPPDAVLAQVADLDREKQAAGDSFRVALATNGRTLLGP
jgi:6-methylsalicylate decarboxylase